MNKINKLFLAVLLTGGIGNAAVAQKLVKPCTQHDITLMTALLANLSDATDEALKMLQSERYILEDVRAFMKNGRKESIALAREMKIDFSNFYDRCWNCKKTCTINKAIQELEKKGRECDYLLGKKVLKSTKFKDLQQYLQATKDDKPKLSRKTVVIVVVKKNNKE